MNKIFVQLIKIYVPLAVAVTLLCGIVYGALQQDLRQSANYPQIQMAEDVAALLANGEDPALLKSTVKVDMAASLAPYFIIFDAQGKPVFSTVQLNGQVPTPPAGVLTTAEKQGQNKVTWQPRPGVRVATVVVSYKSGGRLGFVLAGRSLRGAEELTDHLGQIILLGWGVSLIVLLAVCLVVGLF